MTSLLMDTIMRAISIVSMIIGLIVLIRTQGQYGQTLLLMGWMGFLADWIAGKFEPQGSSLERHDSNLEPHGPDVESLQEAYALIERLKKENKAE